MRETLSSKKSVTFVKENDDVNMSTPLKKTDLENSRFGQSLEKTAERSPSAFSSSYKSPIKQDIEDETIRCLKDQINFDKELEHAKCTLAMRPDFNLFDAFKIFDVR